MKKVLKYIPNYTLKFLLKMGALVLIFSLCRILFLAFNWELFNEVGIVEFLAGIWFDLVTVAIVFLPLGVLEMLPNKWRDTGFFKWFFFGCFQVIVFLSVLMNFIDIGYFKHTSSRLKATLLDTLGGERDAGVQVGGYIGEYWYLLIFLALIIWLSVFLYQRIDRIEGQSKSTSWWLQLILYPTMVALLVFIGRGGLRLRPVQPSSAAKYTSSVNMPLVLNSAFTFIKSWGAEELEKKDYFNSEELYTYFNPIKTYDSNAEIGRDNVVLIILESFSPEYIGAMQLREDSTLGYKEGFRSSTPFFDWLAGESLLCYQTFANGKKSVDAMPSIISSIPKLMDQEYLNSMYSANDVESLPKSLKSLGYNSSFYHAASNGSMNFDVYCDLAEFDNYYGRDEYDNEDHFDGRWGIFDHYFLPYCIEKMNEKSEPFFSTIFTISSHDPYTIPDEFKDKFNKGPSPNHNAIEYMDFALSEFFKKAKMQPWFNNTLFVITADHTPASGVPEYFTEIGKMRVPLLFYHPTNELFHGRNDKITSQNDIMPTILDLVGYNEPFFAYGESIFKKKSGISASQIGEAMLIFKDVDSSQYMGMMYEDEFTHIYDIKDQFQTKNIFYGDTEELRIHLENHLKALIQVYHAALSKNQMKARNFEL